MNVWTRNANVWVLNLLPQVTVEPIPCADGKNRWGVKFGGKVIPYIMPGTNSDAVKSSALRYYEKRIDI